MTSPSSIDPATSLLAFEEGFVNRVYLCPSGYPTVGFGRRVRVLDYETGEEVPFPITREAETEVLNEKVLDKHLWLDSKYAWYSTLSPIRQAVLISLLYQVGETGFTKFKKMISALARSDFETAADEYLDSAAARQCPARFGRGARALRYSLPLSQVISPLE